MSLVIKYNESKAIPEGIYIAKLSKLEPVTHPQWGDSIRWAFEIADGEHANTTVTAMSSTKVSPKSKIFTWVQAFGQIMTPGNEFDLETLIGKTVRVRIVNKTQSKMIDGKTLDQTFSNVDALAPYIPDPSAPAPIAPTVPVEAQASAQSALPEDAIPAQASPESFSNTAGGVEPEADFDF